MKNKTILKLMIVFGLVIGIHSCKDKTKTEKDIAEKKETIRVFSFDNKQEFSEYQSLNLDDSHPNLLNPTISKSDYNSVIKSWSDLHQRIGNFLSENKFTWGVEDEAIRILQKIYFEPDGKMKYYFYRVLNEDVTKEKQELFAKLISEFAKTNRIDFQMDRSFAQCGKTEYPN